MKIIFILYNIYEIKSGVSNKYIKFIEYLNKINIDFLVFTTFIKKYKNISNKLINLKGFRVPFYNNIKIPNIKYNELLKYINNNDIIIFNGEFYWIYNILKQIKNKHKNIKIIPNWHTNYEYYSDIYFKNTLISKKIKNILYQNLKNNFFSGIISTGEISKIEFKKYSNNVFNANEICLDNFKNTTIDNYNLNNTINFIYTGRIAAEKNLLTIIDILKNIEDSIFNNYIMHFIGNGPFMEELVFQINNSNLKQKIIFYGDINYSKIIKIYRKLDNKIFIQPSISETFGKTTMEASYSKIPIFVIKCNIHNILYNDKNSFLFENVKDFKNQLIFFFKLSQKQKEKIIKNGYLNAEKYDQNIVFKNLYNFILNTESKKDNYYNEILFGNIFKSIKCGIDYFEN